jgi:eukaryotic-like serine/threonine-protein kinase
VRSVTDSWVPEQGRSLDQWPGDGAPPGQAVGGRYRLLHRLGRGGMAVVWQGHDELLHRDVAVKEVLPPRDLSPDQHDEIRQRAMREARAAARLAHPSAVTVYDVVEDGGRPWIVMALLPPHTLADVLATRGPLTPAAATRLGLELIDALRTAHAAGVLHRDVKPSNVMITDDGRAVLTDFGIATVEEDPSITATGMLIGSPGYMAPERARGERPTPASDLWSLGATLYAATEGDPPFRREGQLATLHAAVSEPAPPAVHAGPLQPLIARLLERDPVRRIGADEAYEQLRRITIALSGAAQPVAERPADPAAGPPPARRGLGSGAFVALSALVLVAAAVATFLLLQPSSGPNTPPVGTHAPTSGSSGAPGTTSGPPSTRTRASVSRRTSTEPQTIMSGPPSTSAVTGSPPPSTPPTGPESTGPDSTDPDSTSPGPTGPDSTSPGPTGPDSTSPQDGSSASRTTG